MHGIRLAAHGAVLCLLALMPALSALAADSPESAEQLEMGRRIYRQGVLPSGAPLQGVRRDGTAVAGAAAACVKCHRQSGMGSVEGDLQVPPIASNYLFKTSQKALATMDPHVGKAMNLAHEPYTETSLARAIRHGVGSDGREMGAVMPRFTLDDAELQALTAYLRQLSRQWSPGVSAASIRFATIVTPDVEPERRKVFLDMMHAAFLQKNGSTLPGRRHMISPAEMLLRTERTWDLDVWELHGEPASWAAQLADHYRRQPVFAVVSGLTNGNWEPIHRFCESERVPCWFPSVDLPPGQGVYSLYFTRGVALEAEVLAKHLRTREAHPRRVVQIHRDDYVGDGAARAMREAATGLVLEDRVVEGAGPEALSRALAGLGAGDDVVFWLRPADVALLPRVVPPSIGVAYFSAAMSEGAYGDFPPAWKARSQLVYPYELPERRQANLAYFRAWLKSRGIALVDEPLQSEVYFSLNFLTDTLAEMLDNLYRDYLLERAEDMISRREGSKAEEEWRDRPNLGWHSLRPAAARAAAPQSVAQAGNGSSRGTTIYPRLSLGPSQRFASKGGYIVRFADSGDRLVAESDWIVP